MLKVLAEEVGDGVMLNLKKGSWMNCKMSMNCKNGINTVSYFQKMDNFCFRYLRFRKKVYTFSNYHIYTNY